MGQLLDTDGDRRIPLREHHTIGRSPDKSETVIAAPTVSRIHAALEWRGDGWVVRDLSRNGTWVNGQRIEPGQDVPLSEGDLLNFGEQQGNRYQFIDGAEPVPQLIGSSPGTPSLTLSPYLFLPDEEHPALVVYYSQSEHRWLYDRLAGHNDPAPGKALDHGAVLAVEDREWVAFLPQSSQSTALLPEQEHQLDDYQFRFELSLDEESTRLCLACGGDIIDLGERSHHYLLAHLARHRCEAAAAGLDGKSQGWIDNGLLARELGVDGAHLNILIFRARKQIADSVPGAFDSEHLVERRKGQVRFGCSHFTVHKGETLTHCLPQGTAAGA